jgi:hypothetical protein
VCGICNADAIYCETMSIGAATVNGMLELALGSGARWLVPTDDANVEIAPRQQITYGPSVAGVKASSSAHIFELTVAMDVTKFRIFDAATSGNFIWDGLLNRPACRRRWRYDRDRGWRDYAPYRLMRATF